LLNGATIVQQPVAEITYFHVELPDHEVLLANGLRRRVIWIPAIAAILPMAGRLLVSPSGRSIVRRNS